MKKFEYSDGTLIYYLPKELDHYAAEKIKLGSEKVFDENEVKYIIFDFDKTLFMDSSGIGLITGRYRRVHDKGGKAYILNVNDSIDKLLTMSGIYRIIEKKDTKEDIIKEMVAGGYYE
ncbi:MAG: anti-sigma factor antagonist [Lachnospiraceae bacterium]|nr:anti-sigma factor antagonist [Lachnospiraceae bacterium]MBQ9233933.1 anti-sigma factor antagonist [Lachnospiraceae bacterium]